MKPITLGALFAVILWLAVTISAAFMEKTYRLIDEAGSRSLYSDRHHTTALNWIENDYKSFTCLFFQSVGIHYCGLNVQLGDGMRQGVDFSSYTQMRIKIEYRGGAEKLRLSLRNVIDDPTFSADSKYHQVEVPISNGTYQYVVPLDNFQVASWWLENRKPRGANFFQPERDNVVHIGFDIETPLPIGQHYFRVLEYTLVEPWLRSVAGWWIGGSCLYFLIVGLFLNFFRLQVQLQQRHEEMFGLLKKLEKVDTESAHFKRLSMYDPLTGLLNRRAALELVEEFAQHNSLAGTSLVIVDIDHFKTVNDTYGHDMGDLVLKSVCSAIQNQLREGDAAIRWGGEEIVVICPKTNMDGAVRVAEKLRQEIKALDFEGVDLKVTASFGVSIIHSGESFNQAFIRADDALYDAKNAGRDRVCSKERRYIKG